jgi:hypothetical protein
MKLRCGIRVTIDINVFLVITLTCNLLNTKWRKCADIWLIISAIILVVEHFVSIGTYIDWWQLKFIWSYMQVMLTVSFKNKIRSAKFISINSKLISYYKSSSFKWSHQLCLPLHNLLWSWFQFEKKLQINYNTLRQ